MIKLIETIFETIFGNYALTKLFIAFSFLVVMTILFFICERIDKWLAKLNKAQ